MNAFLMPEVSGRLLIFSLSRPAIQAVANIDKASKTPRVTKAASALVSSFILPLLFLQAPIAIQTFCPT